MGAEESKQIAILLPKLLAYTIHVNQVQIIKRSIATLFFIISVSPVRKR